MNENYDPNKVTSECVKRYLHLPEVKEFLRKCGEYITHLNIQVAERTQEISPEGQGYYGMTKEEAVKEQLKQYIAFLTRR